MFVDRDGVINEEREYVYRIEDFHLLPRVGEGLRQLQRAGYLLVVVTIQAGPWFRPGDHDARSGDTLTATISAIDGSKARSWTYRRR